MPHNPDAVPSTCEPSAAPPPLWQDDHPQIHVLKPLVWLYLEIKVKQDFRAGSVLKNPPANAGDTGDISSIPGSGKIPLEEEMVTHSSFLAWKIPWAEEPGGLQSMGSLRSRTRLSDFTFTFHFHALEKEMATHSSVLAWRIPGTGSLVGCRLWGRTESDTMEAT